MNESVFFYLTLFNNSHIIIHFFNACSLLFFNLLFIFDRLRYIYLAILLRRLKAAKNQWIYKYKYLTKTQNLFQCNFNLLAMKFQIIFSRTLTKKIESFHASRPGMTYELCFIYQSVTKLVRFSDLWSKYTWVPTSRTIVTVWNK